MKKCVGLILIIPLILSLCACNQSEFVDLGAFVENFCARQTEQTLDLTDFKASSNGDGTIFNCFFPCGDSAVTARLFANPDQKIEQCRIIVPKLDENGNETDLGDEILALFLQTARNSVCGLTFCSQEEASRLTDEFRLSDRRVFSEQGELTKEKGDFYYVYLSNSLLSEFIIYNKRLHEIPSTKKPESKAAYGNTANIREETVPLM